MLPTLGDALQVAGAAGPWFAIALIILGYAGRLAKQLRASAQSQGERLGALERQLSSERDRRRQVEYELLELGVDLPFWPPDGPKQPRSRTRRYDPEETDDPPAPPSETEVRRIPVPPLPDDDHRLARHRR